MSQSTPEEQKAVEKVIESPTENVATEEAETSEVQAKVGVVRTKTKKAADTKAVPGRRRGKKYQQAAALVDSEKLYGIKEAIDLALKSAYVKFDASLEVHFHLGVDPKKPDQAVRGTINLPHGSGRTQRVIVFAQGDDAAAAKAAGADEAGAEELIEKVKGGWMDFDVVVASPDMMAKIAQLGKVLGTKGLMPNPKAGTVTKDVAKAVAELKSGRLEYRLEKMPIIHTVFGKVSMGAQKLQENLEALVATIARAKPGASKGTYLQSIHINTTMGPGISLDPLQLKNLR